MSKDKQIDIDIAVEEMASAVREITVACSKCEYYKDGSCLKPIDIGCDINEDILNECDALYNAGYRRASDVANVRNIYDRLCELEDKIEQGKLLELPCKIGDEKFAILTNTDVIVKGVVCTIIYQNEFLIDFAYKSEEYDYTAYAQLLPEELFDTYEEAEAKLREMGGDNYE